MMDLEQLFQQAVERERTAATKREQRSAERREWAGSSEERVCAAPGCANSFSPRTQDSRYCSTACAKRGYDAERKQWKPKQIGDIRCSSCQTLFAPRNVEQTLCPSCHRKTYERERGTVRNGRPRTSHEQHPDRRRPLEDPFISWDGEGIGDRYILLADSRGNTLFNRDGLSTHDCLEFLLDHGDTQTKRGIHVWYANDYDVQMILRDMPLFDKSGSEHDFFTLASKGEVIFDRKRITWRPHQQFTIDDYRTGRHYSSVDTFKLFQSRFESAAREWCKSVPDILSRGKASREDFSPWSDEDIIAYNACELTLHVEIMDKFREACWEAGLPVTKWYGPGAIAGDWLRANHIEDHIVDLPREVELRVRQAYFGGRIEGAGWGKVEPWHHYDINSAYPFALTKVISLQNVTWELRKNPRKIGDHTLCHVVWDIGTMGKDGKVQTRRWGPFPYRMKTGAILTPMKGEGWYWGVEVRAAKRLYDAPGDIRVLECYDPVPVEEFVFPFSELIQNMAAYRLKLKAEGKPAHKPLKLCLNSLYGKLAQRTRLRWNTKTHEWVLDKPSLQCYAWAGFVTAHCRAQLLDAIRLAGQEVVMAQTDGVVSTVPIPLPVGPNLGEWEYEEKEKSGIVVMAGVYQAFDADGELVEGTYHARGFDLSKHLDLAPIIDLWEAGVDTDPPKGKKEGGHPLCEAETRSFIGVGRAKQQPSMREHFGTFQPIKKRLGCVPRVGTEKRKGQIENVLSIFDMELNREEGGFHYLPVREYGEAIGPRARKKWAQEGGRIPESMAYKQESSPGDEFVDETVMDEFVGI